MDQLIDACRQLKIKNTWYNNTIYDLYVHIDESNIEHVYTRDFIYNGAYIGELIGEKKYCWEVEMSRYIIWVEDEYVVDCEAEPRCITSLIQEGFYEGKNGNCDMVVYMDRGITRVGIFARRDIQPSEELIFIRTNDYY